jgi:hypothetical protein
MIKLDKKKAEKILKILKALIGIEDDKGAINYISRYLRLYYVKGHKAALIEQKIKMEEGK